jgi:hypothetical protein
VKETVERPELPCGDAQERCPAAQHSVGPWRLTVDAKHGGNWRITAKSRRHIAKVYAASLDRDPVCDANALLIAAAPQMVAALIGAVRAWERIMATLPYSPAIEDAEFTEFLEARRAIAEALDLSDWREAFPEHLAEAECERSRASAQGAQGEARSTGSTP